MFQVQQQSKTNECYEQKLNTYLEVVEQEMDASYNRINDSIHQIFSPSNCSDALELQTSYFTKSQMQSTLQIPFISMAIHLQNQVTQEIKPLIQTIVSKQINNKEQILNEKHLKESQEVKQNFNNLFEEKRQEYDQIIKLKEQQIQQLQITQSQVQNIIYNTPQSNLNQFTFQLLKPNSIKQYEDCFAIAINKNNSIVVAACNKIIKVYELKQGTLNQIQFLSEHTNDITTLNFMKQSNNFVSGSSDCSIIIWQLNQNNQWTCQQKLNGHSDWISCLLVNNNEDLIISGSWDSSIKFWDKQKGWSCQQTINDHTDYVFSLSLNEQQDKLISCSDDSQILVYEQSQKDKRWSVIQKIKVDQWGYRLCFIENKQFTFQPYYKEQMYVYEMNDGDKQFFKTKQITVQLGSKGCYYLFPQQYLKSRCLLVNKNGEYINLIRKKQNGEFITEQTIQFNDDGIFGSLSDDGEYLITWNKKSKEIQIRKCIEK